MQDHRLVLYPLDSTVTVDGKRLTQLLTESGLIGEEHDWQGEAHFLPGAHFLEQVVFLGCSPFINLAPPGDDKQGSEYCHIALPSVTQPPAFLGGDNVRTPSCPHCKQAIENWRDGLAASEDFTCQACGEAISLPDINWRRSAAFARCSVQIWGIHDGEAVPSDLLMKLLAELAGSEWGYFYRQSR